MKFCELYSRILCLLGPSVRLRAVKKLRNQEVLVAEVAKHDADSAVRRVALEKLTDQAALAEVAKYATDSDVQLAAFDELTELTDQTVLADYGFFSVTGATVNGHKLPDGSAVSDMNGRVLPVKFQVLGCGRYNGPRKNAAVFSNAGPFHYSHIRSDPGAFSDLYILVNNRKRIYLNVGSESGIGMYIGVGMNHER
jgi:hypothetical protein